VRVCLTTNGKIWSGYATDVASTGLKSTDGHIDVYGAIIFGEKAYIETTVNGQGNGVIVQPLGSSGAADPLKQRGSIAWHDPYVAFISDNNRIYRIECGCTA
jgi:N4-gp56 family major capsid protein